MAQVFPLAAESGVKSLWLMALVVIPLVAITAYFVLSPRLVRFEISKGQLRIAGDAFYGRTMPLADLDIDQAQSADLSASSEYKLSWRTNGVGLPNYKGGWFKLTNGHKALVFIGDRRRAVVIPHRKGHFLILSPADPDAFLRALRDAVR